MTAAFARRSPAAVGLALATVYLVWGSTYLAIRVTDRTLPPRLIALAWHRDRYRTPAARAFVETAQEVTAELELEPVAA